ncbi:hypothetical protein SEA_MARCIE_67 [Microbacterium phage Marcie]|nr:hypothetical protein SEA_MARCIE_67 [Microbacterium phage Marcie]
MALNSDTTSSRRETPEEIRGRFFTAQDGRPSDEQLEVQAQLRDAFAGIAVYANEKIADSRHKSLALTAMEDALMRFGKAIFS